MLQLGNTRKLVVSASCPGCFRCDGRPEGVDAFLSNERLRHSSEAALWAEILRHPAGRRRVKGAVCPSPEDCQGRQRECRTKDALTEFESYMRQRVLRSRRSSAHVRKASEVDSHNGH